MWFKQSPPERDLQEMWLIKSGWVPDCIRTCKPWDAMDLCLCLPSYMYWGLETYPEHCARHLKAEVWLFLLKDSPLWVLCELTNSYMNEMRADQITSHHQNICSVFSTSSANKIINHINVLMQFDIYISFLKCKFWIDILRTGRKISLLSW